MLPLTLVIGNKNYSTWSLRAWLALKQTGAPFEEVVVPLYQPDSKERILQYSAAGQVPVLVHGDVVVWESLAICEYIAETFPEARLWPESAVARAYARAVATEMHNGFPALRTNLPMSIRDSRKRAWFPADVRAQADRVLAIWTTCRERFGASGPFLFGHFTIADAMYAPLAHRFRIYGYPVSGAAQVYLQAMETPAMREWEEAARRETTRIPQFD